MSTLPVPIAAYPIRSGSSLPCREGAVADEYTEMEKKLLEQYGENIAQLRESLAGAAPLEGVEYDERGIPIGYTVMEWFDELDQKLIAHWGEEYRELANKRRTGWNEEGQWKFDIL
ncbi:MAG: hypothetical protein LBO71_02040 [Prevotellaceae bacterium]|jgi:hypothetical protein|nr:hypothetical protein [Prevotellaceae bacterium]